MRKSNRAAQTENPSKEDLMNFLSQDLENEEESTEEKRTCRRTMRSVPGPFFRVTAGIG